MKKERHRRREAHAVAAPTTTTWDEIVTYRPVVELVTGLIVNVGLHATVARL